MIHHPSSRARPVVAVLEQSRWWTSAIRRKYQSWQINVLEYNQLSKVDIHELSKHDLWIVDYCFPEKEAVNILEHFVKNSLLHQSMFILPEERAAYQWKLREIGCSEVLIAPHREARLIKWIENHVRIPEIRSVPSQ